MCGRVIIMALARQVWWGCAFLGLGAAAVLRLSPAFSVDRQIPRSVASANHAPCAHCSYPQNTAQTHLSFQKHLIVSAASSFHTLAVEANVLSLDLSVRNLDLFCNSTLETGRVQLCVFIGDILIYLRRFVAVTAGRAKSTAMCALAAGLRRRGWSKR